MCHSIDERSKGNLQEAVLYNPVGIKLMSQSWEQVPLPAEPSHL